MSVLEGTIQLRQGTAAEWAAANPTLLSGEVGFETDTRRKKTGDDTTAWNSLSYDEGGSNPSRVLSGGGITVGSYGGGGTNNDIRVAAVDYYIEGVGTFSAASEDFLDIALSGAGTERLIGLYANSSSDIVKVEGTAAALAAPPETPPNSILLGYVLVTDAGVASGPGSVNFSEIGGSPSDNAALQAALDAKLNASAVDTDTTLAANSDAKVPSQKAIKAYVDNEIAAAGTTQSAVITTLFSTTSLTLVNVTGLSINLTAGVRYFIRVWCDVNTTTSGQIAYELPAGVGRLSFRGTSTDSITRRYTSNTTTTAQSGTTTGPGYEELRGIWTPSADGTLQIKALSTTGAAFTVFEYARIVITEI